MQSAALFQVQGIRSSKLFWEFFEKFRNSEKSHLITKPTNFYKLDVIISVGYRVKATRGTQFRVWANKILKENGYVFIKNHKVDTFYLHETLQNKLLLKTDIFEQLPPKAW